MLKIDKNIPIPKGMIGRPRLKKVMKYDATIINMEVGDSFEVLTFEEITNVRNSVAFLKGHNPSFNQKKFVTRKIEIRCVFPNDKENDDRSEYNFTFAYRIWRTI